VEHDGRRDGRAAVEEVERGGEFREQPQPLERRPGQPHAPGRAVVGADLAELQRPRHVRLAPAQQEAGQVVPRRPAAERLADVLVADAPQEVDLAHEGRALVVEEGELLAQHLEREGLARAAAEGHGAPEHGRLAAPADGRRGDVREPRRVEGRDDEAVVQEVPRQRPPRTVHVVLAALAEVVLDAELVPHAEAPPVEPVGRLAGLADEEGRAVRLLPPRLVRLRLVDDAPHLEHGRLGMPLRRGSLGLGAREELDQRLALARPPRLRGRLDHDRRRLDAAGVVHGRGTRGSSRLVLVEMASRDSIIGAPTRSGLFQIF
jgi:hypothetical protein